LALPKLVSVLYYSLVNTSFSFWEALPFVRKNPGQTTRGNHNFTYQIKTKDSKMNPKTMKYFSHPDCTVGTGITPVQLLAQVADLSFDSPPVGNFTLPRRLPYLILRNLFYHILYGCQ
jgi:hypothetical protein